MELPYRATSIFLESESSFVFAFSVCSVYSVVKQVVPYSKP